MQTLTKDSSQLFAEWAITEPLSRNFHCSIVTPVVGPDDRLMYTDARLAMVAHDGVVDLGADHCEVVIVVPNPDEGRRWMNNLERSRLLRPVNAHLEALGLAWNDPGASRAGTWRHYLHEAKRMHAALAFLGWDLTPDERALVDAVDAYAERCPAWVRQRAQEASRD